MNKFLLIVVLFLSGCSTFSLGDLQTEGSQASALCTSGGPGGRSGIGAGGIVTGGKVNDGFKGTVAVDKDCNILIESK